MQIKLRRILQLVVTAKY